jgi:muconate cycloisomerase
MRANLMAVPADLRRDVAIEAITSTIVDIPTVRRHKLSQTSVTAQS